MGDSIDYAVKKSHKLKMPENYRVVLYNDDYTAMDFVVFVLMSIFGKNREDAENTMLDIHEKGRGIAGIYTYDIACTKAVQVISLAAEEGFPLKCIIEEV